MLSLSAKCLQKENFWGLDEQFGRNVFMYFSAENNTATKTNTYERRVFCLNIISLLTLEKTISSDWTHGRELPKFKLRTFAAIVVVLCAGFCDLWKEGCLSHKIINIIQIDSLRQQGFKKH